LEFFSSTDVFELEETTTNELPDFSIIENANSSKIKPSDKRFRDVKFDDIDNFLKENEKENTRKKTTSDRWLKVLLLEMFFLLRPHVFRA
jgi:hypothetical protein